MQVWTAQGCERFPCQASPIRSASLAKLLSSCYCSGTFRSQDSAGQPPVDKHQGSPLPQWPPSAASLGGVPGVELLGQFIIIREAERAPSAGSQLPTPKICDRAGLAHLRDRDQTTSAITCAFRGLHQLEAGEGSQRCSATGCHARPMTVSTKLASPTGYTWPFACWVFQGRKITLLATP